MKKILSAALAAIVLAMSLSGCNNASDSDSQNSGSSSVENTLTLTASEMAERALGYNPDNWSMAMSLAGSDELSLLMPELTPDMFEDFCLYYDMIGINGHRVFVGKPKAGQEETVKAAIEKSFTSYKDQASFYPAGQDSVAGAVSGTTSHGYSYFIIHQDGAGAASAMVDPNAPKVDFSNTGNPDDENSSDENSGDETPALQYPENQAGNMVKTALETNPESWGEGMAIATSAELPKILKNDITAEMFEEYCLAYDTFSGHTVFVGKAAAGQEDAAKTAVENAFTARKTEVAVFAESAVSENAVSGITEDGYIYFVIHADGAAIASAMTTPVF